jgi:hypothetical protein
MLSKLWEIFQGITFTSYEGHKKCFAGQGTEITTGVARLQPYTCKLAFHFVYDSAD